MLIFAEARFLLASGSGPDRRELTDLMLEVQRAAAEVVNAVLSGRSLAALLPAALRNHIGFTAADRGAFQDLCYGALRHYVRMDCMLQQLLRKPANDTMLRSLLVVAMYQLTYTKAAPYAVVDHAVDCASALGLRPARGLVNAVLRGYLRRCTELQQQADSDDTTRYSYPSWWIARLKNQYPGSWREILDAGNTHPPLTLRVNARRGTPRGWVAARIKEGISARIVEPDAVLMGQPIPVERIPGFADGTVSVQDAGAQWAAQLLDIRSGMRVLDACAAPGGKTGHLLERHDVRLLALDLDASRLDRVRANLLRLGLEAEVLCADAARPDTWWDGKPFDRILCDAPCSSSGVVRRHPDSKWLRREADIENYVTRQADLLAALWQMLATGGKLLYVTCSLFREENLGQVENFLARNPQARRLPLALPRANDGQLLPDSEQDGFFYALLAKA